MKRLRSLCLTLLTIATASAADSKLPLQDGELLQYRVAWGIFLHAGEIAIRAHSEINDGIPQLAVTTTTSTRGVLRRLYKFEAQADSVFDPKTGRLLILTETSAGGKKKTNTALEFDYTNNSARFTDFLNSAKNEVIPLPEGNATDLIMSLIQTRFWDLKPGEKRDTNVVFGKEIYLLTVHALGYEQVETRMGSYNTVVLEPRMDKTPPKGMFRRGSRVHVWIAQDELHLPVKFEVEFSFGAGVATLDRYEPPTGSTPAAEPAAKP